MTWLDGFTARTFFDLAAALTLLLGMAFLFIGAIGVMRLPDAYNRIHAASVCVTLGLTGMIVAACFHIGTTPILTKAAATIVFILAATPVGSHLLAKAAHHGALPIWERTLSDELTADKEDPSKTASDEFDAAARASKPRSNTDDAGPQRESIGSD